VRDKVQVYRNSTDRWEWKRTTSDGNILSFGYRSFPDSKEAMNDAIRCNSIAEMLLEGQPIMNIPNLPEHLRKDNNG
jgi:hypothetical protein